MDDNRRHIPEKREMDVIENLFKKHWGKIVVGTFVAGGAWATLQFQVSGNAEEIRYVKKEQTIVHDFMITQIETNKKIDKMDIKLDKLLNRH